MFSRKDSLWNIRQGVFGNCCFLAAVSALAEDGDRIIRLFKTVQSNKEGRYAAKIMVKGRWQVIPVDDYLPFLNKKPFGAHTTSPSELWLPIL